MACSVCRSATRRDLSETIQNLGRGLKNIKIIVGCGTIAQLSQNWPWVGENAAGERHDEYDQAALMLGFLPHHDLRVTTSPNRRGFTRRVLGGQRER